jgi:tRNA nucleotidyltransferase (CCA-adding enzyme)
VRAEFNQIIMHDAMCLTLLKHTNLLKYIIPEFDDCFNVKQNHPMHCHDVARHSILATMNISSTLHLKLAMLFHDIGKPMTKETIDGVDHFYRHAQRSMEIAEVIMKRMKYDNETIDKVLMLIKYHDAEFSINKPFIRRMLNKMGVELFKDLLQVRKADIFAQQPMFYSERFSKIMNIEILLEKVLVEEHAFSIKHLAIDGNDLINLGFKQGKIIGDTLVKLLDMVMENPEMNTKEILIEMAINKIKIEME